MRFFFETNKKKKKMNGRSSSYQKEKDRTRGQPHCRNPVGDFPLIKNRRQLNILRILYKEAIRIS
jgi:hypothetical protein